MRIIAALTLGLAMSLSFGVQAQTYPNRAVTVVVPLPPGSLPDIVARVLADRLAKKWAVPVSVLNRPGAGLNIGARAVAEAEPDGYTLLLTPPGPLTSNEFLYANLPYQPKAFQPISVLARFSFVLVVRPDLDVKTLSDLVRVAKAKPAGLFFGSTGPASPPYLIAEMFQKAAGVKFTPVPYQGLTLALNEVVGRRLDMMFYDVGDAAPFIQEGKVRPLAVTSSDRSSELPSVPAIAEDFPGFSAVSWLALVAPPNTTRGILDKIYGDVESILKDPEGQAMMERLHVHPMVLAPIPSRAFIEEDAARWRDVILSTGMKPQ